MPDSPTSNGSRTSFARSRADTSVDFGTHGVPIVTIRSPQLTSSIHSEPDENAWSHAFGSIAVDAPEPTGNDNQECPGTEGGPLTDPPNADAQEGEPAQPHTEAVPPSEARSDPSDALPSLRSIFCALVGRLRESFASAPAEDEPILSTPDNDATTAPPLDRETTAPSVAEHGVQEEADAEERDSPAMPPTTEAETPARGLSIRLLDVGTSPLRPALRPPPSDEHTERDTQPASDAAPEASAETTDAPRPAQFLLYIPRAASPFPFGFLYDAESSMAWPILDHDSSGIADGQPRTVHVVGLPFHMSFAFRNAEPEERPDPARAASYVKSLEPVDSELRMRMSRFGISDIGLYGGFDVADGPVTGCGICLEPYAPDDRPAWFAGEEQSANESVVVVPCHGHHTLHRACLQGWLENTAPGKWSCPFCRTNLHKCAEEKELVSLREHVRAKERAKGWRCDAPACLPCYEDDPSASRAMGNVGMEWVTMLPCRHEVHMDCLCTGMSVEACESLESDDYDTGSESDSDLDTPCDMSLSNASLQPSLPPHASPAPEKHNTVGKWVTCPSCRKEAWAQLPIRRRPWRSLENSIQISM